MMLVMIIQALRFGKLSARKGVSCNMLIILLSQFLFKDIIALRANKIFRGVLLKLSNKRPVNLQLSTIKLPITAIVSILHRASGVFVFLIIPFLLGWLAHSLKSPESFAALQTCLSHPLTKLFVFVFFAALIYHLLAGVRHLLMDLGIGEGKQSGKCGARLVLVVSVILVIGLGVWLW